VAQQSELAVTVAADTGTGLLSPSRRRADFSCLRVAWYPAIFSAVKDVIGISRQNQESSRSSVRLWSSHDGLPRFTSR
jgi:hypothetical protein